MLVQTTFQFGRKGVGLETVMLGHASSSENFILDVDHSKRPVEQARKVVVVVVVVVVVG